ncbi:MAG: hypothetical protein BWY10_02515 [Chloroflexi bacterium ADurb.Bin180]|nr:MAG: hypothetical protein BWY10_02515 [Chloroflexi bacterium ADurb.Bin180]
MVVESSLQSPVKALDFALRLRMPVASEVQSNTLLDQLCGYPGQAQMVSRAPPGQTVVHQHGVRHAIDIEGLQQTTIDRLGSETDQGIQPDQKPAVIVQETERITESLLNGELAFEIHLPEHVGSLALKSFRGLPMPVFRKDQIVPTQNAIHCRQAGVEALTVQQNLQLLGTPAMLLAQRYHSLLNLGAHPTRTVSGTTRALLQRVDAAFALVAMHPLVASLSADPKLLAQVREGHGMTQCPNNKPDSLFHRIRLFPRHTPLHSVRKVYR